MVLKHLLWLYAHPQVLHQELPATPLAAQLRHTALLVATSAVASVLLQLQARARYLHTAVKDGARAQRHVMMVLSSSSGAAGAGGVAAAGTAAVGSQQQHQVSGGVAGGAPASVAAGVAAWVEGQLPVRSSTCAAAAACGPEEEGGAEEGGAWEAVASCKSVGGAP